MNASLRLLVVDDDDVDRQLLRRGLASCGFQFDLTEYADTARLSDVHAIGSFDCIFLDYLLPGSNGLLLLQKMRERGDETPVVIVTSQGNESIAVDLMKAGATDYVVKNDISGPVLAKILHRILRAKEALQEKRQAEAALRVSEARLAEAQRIARLGNWEFDIATRELYCSPEIYKIFGLESGHQASVESLIRRIHEEDRQAAVGRWTDGVRGGIVDFDFRLSAAGQPKFVNTQGYGVRDGSGNLIKVIGTVQDITIRKQAEREISDAMKLAENSLQVREVFLATMSHEIRTPMNAILGFTRLLLETPLTEEQRGYIDAIHFSGENLLVIINDILDLSKIRSGKMTMEKCEFVLADLITGIISVLDPKAREKGLYLSYSVESKVPGQLVGDPVRLNQVLTNLISNAIKFTSKGGIMVDIRVNTLRNEDIVLEFNIRDTGIGIPDEKHALIFESFVQASGETTRKFGGTGLGLAIVKNLVELLEGKITLVSQPGQGSTFTVHLPFGRVIAEETSAHSQAGGMSAFQERDQLRGLNVLVVEDNAVNQLLVKKVLGKAGCIIDIASDGVQALACLRTKQYNVILMDIQMPEMDGYQATREIRKSFPSPASETPIIAMTAHAFGSDVTRCMSEGMNDYISKPFKAEDLYAKLIKHVRERKAGKLVALTQASKAPGLKVDLTAIAELGNNDAGFVEDMLAVYNEQTPALIERLTAFMKSNNYGGIRSICHQIRSSYGILKLQQLDAVLRELSAALTAENREEKIGIINEFGYVLISLISAINEQLQRGLRKTG